MNGWRRVRGLGVLGCRPNTTGLRVAGGMPGKPKRIRGCYKKVHFFFALSVGTFGISNVNCNIENFINNIYHIINKIKV